MEFERDVATRTQKTRGAGHAQVSPSRSHTDHRKGTASHRKRPEVRGKAIYIGEQPFFVKGVSYGAFRPDAESIAKATIRRRNEFDIEAACDL